MNEAILLLPPWKRCAASVAVANGVLSRWVSRGDRLAEPAALDADSLKTQFEWPGTSFPVAALSRQFDAGDAQGSAWMRADPCHIRADMVTARMLACGELGLSAEECESIARDLRPLFGDAGFEFDARRVDRWYLRAPLESRLPECANPDQAIGDDLKLHLPQGSAGKRWRHLFNEAQIVLHNHPVNAARARRGAVSVNGLWFWGAGALPSFVRSRLRAVFSNRPELRALATLAGIASHPLLAEDREAALETAATGKSLLFDLVELRDQALETTWLTGFDLALKNGAFEQLQLQFSSAERFVVRRWHRWRVWRSVGGFQS